MKKLFNKNFRRFQSFLTSPKTGSGKTSWGLRNLPINLTCSTSLLEVSLKKMPRMRLRQST